MDGNMKGITDNQERPATDHKRPGVNPADDQDHPATDHKRPGVKADNQKHPATDQERLIRADSDPLPRRKTQHEVAANRQRIAQMTDTIREGLVARPNQSLERLIRLLEKDELTPDEEENAWKTRTAVEAIIEGDLSKGAPTIQSAIPADVTLSDLEDNIADPDDQDKSVGEKDKTPTASAEHDSSSKPTSPAQTDNKLTMNSDSTQNYQELPPAGDQSNTPLDLPTVPYTIETTDYGGTLRLAARYNAGVLRDETVLTEGIKVVLSKIPPDKRHHIAVFGHYLSRPLLYHNKPMFFTRARNYAFAFKENVFKKLREFYKHYHYPRYDDEAPPPDPDYTVVLQFKGLDHTDDLPKMRGYRLLTHCYDKWYECEGVARTPPPMAARVGCCWAGPLFQQLGLEPARAFAEKEAEKAGEGTAEKARATKLTGQQQAKVTGQPAKVTGQQPAKATTPQERAREETTSGQTEATRGQPREANGGCDEAAQAASNEPAAEDTAKQAKTRVTPSGTAGEKTHKKAQRKVCLPTPGDVLATRLRYGLNALLGGSFRTLSAINTAVAKAIEDHAARAVEERAAMAVEERAAMAMEEHATKAVDDRMAEEAQDHMADDTLKYSPRTADETSTSGNERDCGNEHACERITHDCTRDHKPTLALEAPRNAVELAELLRRAWDVYTILQSNLRTDNNAVDSFALTNLDTEEQYHAVEQLLQCKIYLLDDNGYIWRRPPDKFKPKTKFRVGRSHRTGIQKIFIMSINNHAVNLDRDLGKAICNASLPEEKFSTHISRNAPEAEEREIRYYSKWVVGDYTACARDECDDHECVRCRIYEPLLDNRNLQSFGDTERPKRFWLAESKKKDRSGHDEENATAHGKNGEEEVHTAEVSLSQKDMNQTDSNKPDTVHIETIEPDCGLECDKDLLGEPPISKNVVYQDITALCAVSDDDRDKYSLDEYKAMLKTACGHPRLQHLDSAVSAASFAFSSWLGGLGARLPVPSDERYDCLREAGLPPIVHVYEGKVGTHLADDDYVIVEIDQNKSYGVSCYQSSLLSKMGITHRGFSQPSYYLRKFRGGSSYSTCGGSRLQPSTRGGSSSSTRVSSAGSRGDGFQQSRQPSLLTKLLPNAAFYYVQFDCDDPKLAGLFQVRTDQGIVYPCEGEGLYSPVVIGEALKRGYRLRCLYYYAVASHQLQECPTGEAKQATKQACFSNPLGDTMRNFVNAANLEANPHTRRILKRCMVSLVGKLYGDRVFPQLYSTTSTEEFYRFLAVNRGCRTRRVTEVTKKHVEEKDVTITNEETLRVLHALDMLADEDDDESYTWLDDDRSKPPLSYRFTASETTRTHREVRYSVEYDKKGEKKLLHFWKQILDYQKTAMYALIQKVRENGGELLQTLTDAVYAKIPRKWFDSAEFKELVRDDFTLEVYNKLEIFSTHNYIGYYDLDFHGPTGYKGNLVKKRGHSHVWLRHHIDRNHGRSLLPQPVPIYHRDPEYDQTDLFSVLGEFQFEFHTGGAGTGKSYRILQEYASLSSEEQRTWLLTSFKGLAAENINGCTYHSTVLRGSFLHRNRQLRVLVIDEISNTSPAQLARILENLYHMSEVRRVVFIGDFAQIPPVATQRLDTSDLWREILRHIPAERQHEYTTNRRFTESPKLFEQLQLLRQAILRRNKVAQSRAIQSIKDLCLESKRGVRFIGGGLSRCRRGGAGVTGANACDVDVSGAGVSGGFRDDGGGDGKHSRSQVLSKARDSTLTIAHKNEEVQRINSERYKSAETLGRELHHFGVFRSERGDNNSSYDFPHYLNTGKRTEITHTELFVGATVVHCKNKVYGWGKSAVSLRNGSRGVVIAVERGKDDSDDKIKVKCRFEVKQHAGDQDSADDGTGNGVEEGVNDTRVSCQPNGVSYRMVTITYDKSFDSSFKHWINWLPLQLGYATTIDKSQGLTADSVRVVGELSRLTIERQYVALSRCRTLDGLYVDEWMDAARTTPECDGDGADE